MELLTNILKETPNVGALLLLCFWFLRALEKQNKRYERLEAEHEAAREHSRTVIEANTRVLAQVMEIIRKCKGPEND